MFDWFKSVLWPGHSRIFTNLSQSYFCIVLAVCLGLLTCWNVNFTPVWGAELSETDFHQGSLYILPHSSFSLSAFCSRVLCRHSMWCMLLSSGPLLRHPPHHVLLCLSIPNASALAPSLYLHTEIFFPHQCSVAIAYLKESLSSIPCLSTKVPGFLWTAKVYIWSAFFVPDLARLPVPVAFSVIRVLILMKIWLFRFCLISPGNVCRWIRGHQYAYLLKVTDINNLMDSMLRININIIFSFLLYLLGMLNVYIDFSRENPGIEYQM